MKILVISGSRADFGILEFPVQVLKSDPFFEVDFSNIWNSSASDSIAQTDKLLERFKPDLVLILGDRFEILGAAIACHLRRIPIAHIGGGDITEGSYDDAMRDSISRMATIHFATSSSAMARLAHMGYKNTHLVGSPGIDYIRRAPWKKERPIAQPYVVVSYQAETIDRTNEIEKVIHNLPDKFQVFMMPNRDTGSDEIRQAINRHARNSENRRIFESLPHADFINLLANCDEFIGNSSAILYEAPELGIRTKMIGKRQKGRTIPFGDGFASERIAKALKYGAF